MSMIERLITRMSALGPEDLEPGVAADFAMLLEVLRQDGLVGQAAVGDHQKVAATPQRLCRSLDHRSPDEGSAAWPSWKAGS